MSDFPRGLLTVAAKETGMPMSHVHNILTRSKKPNYNTAVRLETFFLSHGFRVTRFDLLDKFEQGVPVSIGEPDIPWTYRERRTRRKKEKTVADGSTK